LLLSDEAIMSAFTDCESQRQSDWAPEADRDRSSSVANIAKIAMLILAIAVALYILFPNLSWAEGATGVLGIRSTLHCLSPATRGAGANSASRDRYNSDEPQKKP
jgi:hypothetical protein